MSKPLLWGATGLLVGAAIGAGTMRLIDARWAADGSAPAAGQADKPAEEADPVVAALDANAFFEGIMGEGGKLADRQYGGVGTAGYRIGEAVWEAEPIDEAALRGRADAALKAPILAAGARPLSENVSAGVVQTGTHKLYTFVCFYEARIGGRLQDRQATAWVTVPVRGRQHSACFRFGK